MNDCHRPDIACWSFGGSKECLDLWQNLHTIWWREGRIIWRGVGWTNGRVGWNDRLGIGALISLTGLLWPNYWNGRFMPCSTSESGSSSLVLVPLRLYWWPENKSSVGAEWKYLYIHLQSLLEPTSMFFSSNIMYGANWLNLRNSAVYSSTVCFTAAVGWIVPPSLSELLLRRIYHKNS